MLYKISFAPWMFLAVLLAAGMGIVGPARADERPPNIVLIFVDDMGYGDLGGYGHPTFQSPHLDRLAAEGVRFTNFYVSVPYCGPSRATLLTGRYPFRSGMVGNPHPNGGLHDVGLPAEEITIAEALKPLGYATICLGKWHLGHIPKFMPRTQGFDEYYGILYSNDMWPVQVVHNETVVEYPVVQATLTNRLTERALDFIETNRERPFFLYLPHIMPHKPLAASEDFYRPGSPDDLYAAVVRELDWSVGQILQKLQELGLDDNTLVIFTSDNGPWYGGSTGGLRGMKGTTWEGGIRVPMIARWPKRIPSGLVSEAVSGTVDLFPTICKLAGAEVPSDRTIDGKDIWPLMTQKNAPSPHEAIFAMQGPRLMTIRSGRWKLHVRPPGGAHHIMSDEEAARWIDPVGPDGVFVLAPYEQPKPDRYPGLISGDEPKPMMLFDLEADPGEQYNVADQHPQVMARLKAMYDEMNAQVPEFTSPRRLWQGFRYIRGGDLNYEPLP